jgi:molybdopterin/thiamine biosynthesis adenylyltransferase
MSITCEEASRSSTIGRWSYETAFSRNLGLIRPDEQQRLRASRVAIVGMGGVGGHHLMTLARLGIGKFNIVDPDSFELANFNRQYGATMDTIGAPKVGTMTNVVRGVNPELEIRSLTQPLDQSNIDEFLSDADIVIDGVDFFALDVRRMVFREARRRQLWALTAGPIGFSCAWLSFSPEGMAFDDYFDLDDRQTRLEQLIAFAVGLTPRATQATYMDLNRVDVSRGTGPSLSLACQLCSSIIATEVTKILLGRGGCRSAPHYAQFDPYRGLLRRGRLPRGNRGLLQRAKRRWLQRFFEKKLQK